MVNDYLIHRRRELIMYQKNTHNRARTVESPRPSVTPGFWGKDYKKLNSFFLSSVYRGFSFDAWAVNSTGTRWWYWNFWNLSFWLYAFNFCFIFVHTSIVWVNKMDPLSADHKG